ncbi:hypothetical protein NDU88_006813 [Pleurodeles waltl]|uniref:Uncharacterized protein n=1 Tax=Pleurodeles waltl TaxID=8319 RepID=A0AAV7QIY0_PLEWA|nr:hypothetical protein NDU88_006813 [Pleurodeles waltl]
MGRLQGGGPPEVLDLLSEERRGGAPQTLLNPVPRFLQWHPHPTLVRELISGCSGDVGPEVDVRWYPRGALQSRPRPAGT